MTNARLNVISAGPAHGPVVVLLHSIATGAEMWQAQISDLAGRFRVIALDLPGHGLSAPFVRDPSIADYADAVIATLDSLGVGQFAMVGLSFGSMIAQHVGAHFPDRVTALVLSNGVAWTAPAVADLWQQRIADAEQNGMACQVEPTLARWFSQTFCRSHPREIARIGELVAATSLQGYRQAALAIAALDNRALLPEIAAPALVIAGDTDAAAPTSAIEAISREIPYARLAVMPGSHLLNVELAAEYSRLLIEFLDAVHPLAGQESSGGLG